MKKENEKTLNWNEFDRGVYLVNVLGVVFDTKTRKILIGKRVNDPYVKKLDWCFPGGRPKYGEDLETGLKREIKKKTNLDVESLGAIFARTVSEKKEFLLIYYLCEVVGDINEAKPGEKFIEIKWVKPEELESYFTTSFHLKLKEYILNLS